MTGGSGHGEASSASAGADSPRLYEEPRRRHRRGSPLSTSSRIDKSDFYLQAFFCNAGGSPFGSRDGFDPRRHALSQLALGEHGWIQTAAFALAGLLVLASALGLRRLLRDGPGRT
ncbi:DUF998 domain-containing protein [Nonomuraea sp. LPB2021202275-12-8]|uniref:DUF998 domain-containing protein n=1 Tax=Nonomuraea sp. LPB2021202275-12-8 TaxID=3120159 RepID=UPI003FA6087F